MTVSAITSTTSGATPTAKSMDDLNSTDFLKLLIAELSNQDPFEPMKNQDLMNEVASIRNLQMNSTLNQTLQSLILQGNLGAASNLIGKAVVGKDAKGNEVGGVVAGVQVSNNQVQLALEGGVLVNLDKVSKVSGVPVGQAAQQQG